MRIAIDAMGGDNAPRVNVEGAIKASNEYGVKVFLVGIKEEIEKYIEDKDKNNPNIVVVAATEIINVDESPVTAIKQKPDSSMVVGLKMVKDGNCDAFLSAGSSGAFLAGSLLKVGRIKGILRPALSPLVPTLKGNCIIVDAGANTDCDTRNLQQFAVMGSIYMEKVMGIKSPRVGLLNIGTEEGKGNELTKACYDVLKNTNVNFIGNVEARDIMEGVCDVCVADGFSGNILLKAIEGTALSVVKVLKQEFKKSIKTKFAAILMMDGLKSFKKRFDYAEVGGASFLGINGIMIKAHGSSDSNAIKNAIRQAKLLHDNKCLQVISEEISKLGVEVNDK